MHDIQIDNVTIMIMLLVIVAVYVTRVLSELASYIEAKKCKEEASVKLLEAEVEHLEAKTELLHEEIDAFRKDGSSEQA